MMRKILLSVMAIGMGALIYKGVQNKRGICPELGRRLTDEEYQIAAVNYVINGNKYQKEYIALYKNYNHFMDENPYCCKVYRGGGDHYYIDNFDEITGTLYRFALLRYKLLYKDQHNQIKLNIEERLIPLSRCGVVMSF
jgi:hypothetical protein